MAGTGVAALAMRKAVYSLEKSPHCMQFKFFVIFGYRRIFKDHKSSVALPFQHNLSLILSFRRCCSSSD